MVESPPEVEGPACQVAQHTWQTSVLDDSYLQTLSLSKATLCPRVDLGSVNLLTTQGIRRLKLKVAQEGPVIQSKGSLSSLQAAGAAGA